jgi:hypothetical protein
MTHSNHEFVRVARAPVAKLNLGSPANVEAAAYSTRRRGAIPTLDLSLKSDGSGTASRKELLESMTNSELLSFLETVDNIPDRSVLLLIHDIAVDRLLNENGSSHREAADLSRAAMRSAFESLKS